VVEPQLKQLILLHLMRDLRKLSSFISLVPRLFFMFYCCLFFSHSCPNRKIRIPMASLDDTNLTKRVEEDRSQAIEAATVRIMKVSDSIRYCIIFHVFLIFCLCFLG
jgi:hypothetical protein